MKFAPASAFLVIITALLAACGQPGPNPPPVAEAACQIQTPSPTAPSPPPIIRTDIPPQPSVAIDTATPEPPSPTVPFPSPTLPPTSTWTPPAPWEITPRPTSNFTPMPRPTMPSATDVQLQSNGCYKADVGGCMWDETARFIYEWQPRAGKVAVRLQSDCFDDLILLYFPESGEIE